MDKKRYSLSYRTYLKIVSTAVLFGTTISVYLFYLHYRTYTDFAYSSFCAISKSINCDTVAQSPWSVIAGLPVSLLGIFGYILFLIILYPLIKGDSHPWPKWSFLVCLSGLYSIFSLALGYISSFKIHAYCILCLCIYLINFFIFFITFITKNHLSNTFFFKDLLLSIYYLFRNKTILVGTGILVLLFIVSKIYLPQYWNLEAIPSKTDLPTGITESGHPWIGAENPTLTIEVFSDYQCFQCAKTHFMFRRLLERDSTNMRLVHHHYPMDHEFNPTVVQDPFHVGSGKMALLAVYATTQNKFWQMHDALFQLARSKKPFNTRYLSEKTGLPSPELVAALSHPVIYNHLKLDIHKGMKLRITGTPSFVINGKVYQGSIPHDILRQLRL